MSSDTVIRVESLSKQYRLGLVGTGTLSHDLNRWWCRVRGKPDPTLKVTESNDRSHRGHSEYVWALRDINFEVKRGEVLGIIGRNGAGKSTLLKILSRVTAPTEGQIKIKGRLAALLEVGTGFHPELTGRENIYLNGAILGMTKAEITRKLDEIVDFSGCERYIDTPVKRYSSGMMVRLGFAVAAHLEPEILIVDEVLAVGDAEFQKKCLGKMQDVATGGRTVLFVSHNMAAVRQLTQRCVLLDRGRLEREGSSSDVIAVYGDSTVCARQGDQMPSIRGIRCASRESPDPAALFTRACVSTPSCGVVPVGGRISVDLSCRTVSPLESACFGYALMDSFGTNALTGWSDSFAFAAPGSYSTRLHIDGVWVAPGRYTVTVSLCSRSSVGLFHAYDVLVGISVIEVDRRLVTGEELTFWPGQWGSYVHRQSVVEASGPVPGTSARVCMT